MPELSDRDAFERAFIDALNSANAEARRVIQAALGNPPNLDRLTDDVWQQIEAVMFEAMTPELEAVFLQAIQDMESEVSVSFDTEAVNENARQFARDYGFELVRGVNETSRQELQRLFESFFDEPVTNRALQEQLTRLYGPVRAELIAITEVTRAAAEGERAVIEDLREQGVELVAVWQTLRDELVCPVCGPRHNKRQGDGWQLLPPAHPRCRCFVVYRQG